MDREKREQLIRESKRRGDRIIQQWINERCYTTEEFVEVTGYDEKMLRSLDERGRYFGIPHEGDFYWPKFQGSSPPRHFEIVMGYLRYRDYQPWTIFQFWISAHYGGPSMPNIDRLKQGHLEAVLEDAATLFEQGGR